jgi:glycosyltransferase involved in cell wall biosynthesis
MNILFITEDHSTANYGVTTIISQLADGLMKHYVDMHVVIAATGESAVPQHEKVKVELIPPIGRGAGWRWSPDQASRIKEIIRQSRIDLIHIHGVWMSAPWTGLKLARDLQIPAVLSVHGMWRRWFWEQDKPLRILKKKLYFNWILQHNISQNVTIHALNPAEHEDIRRLMPDNPIVIIPNFIQAAPHTPLSDKPHRMILYLGRLHPLKGVDLLIRAFSLAQLGTEWKLVIAGPEESPAYARRLKEEVIKAGLSDQVTFVGPVFGAAKTDLILKAWAQVLPTFSEGQTMVNLETALCAVPSITTHQAGLSDWQAGGGLLIEPEVDALTHSLIEVTSWSLEERNRRGAQLRAWVIEHYSPAALLPRWEKLYKSLTTGGTQ